jgi:hypothetical protein
MSFSSSINLSSLNGTTGFRLDGVSAGDFSGWSVASAGDVNGDGYADLIIGAQSADPNGDRSGSSYVVFGNASGFTSAIDLSSLNGTSGFRLDGVVAFDLSGICVASAGDVNGDGYADVIVGAWLSRNSHHCKYQTNALCKLRWSHIFSFHSALDARLNKCAKDKCIWCELWTTERPD